VGAEWIVPGQWFRRNKNISAENPMLALHREAVGLVQRRNAHAVVLMNGRRHLIVSSAAIPDQPFELRGIVQNNSTRVLPGSINDEDCRFLAKLGTLDELNLSGAEASLVGLRELGANNPVIALSIPRRLRNTESVLTAFPNLKSVWPPYEGTDQFIAAMKGNPKIIDVNLYRTKVTLQGIADLGTLPNVSNLMLDALDGREATVAMLKALSAYPRLEHLRVDLFGHVEPRDLAPLKKIKTLKSISAWPGGDASSVDMQRYLQSEFTHCELPDWSSRETFEKIYQDLMAFDPEPSVFPGPNDK
ncbi:MAG: hypothetical protein AAFX06_06635, partial [Planctomycetota bacterium]